MVNYSHAAAVMPLFLLADRPGASFATSPNIASIICSGSKRALGTAESGRAEFEQDCDCTGAPVTGWEGTIKNVEISVGNPSDHYTHVCNGAGPPSWVNTAQAHQYEHWEGNCAHGGTQISELTVKSKQGFFLANLNEGNCVNVRIKQTTGSACKAEFYDHCNNKDSSSERLLREAKGKAKAEARTAVDVLRGGRRQQPSRRLNTRNPSPAYAGTTTSKVMDIAVVYTKNAYCRQFHSTYSHCSHAVTAANNATMCAYIENAIDETNEALSRSNVMHSSNLPNAVRLVHCGVEVDYNDRAANFDRDAILDDIISGPAFQDDRSLSFQQRGADAFAVVVSHGSMGSGIYGAAYGGGAGGVLTCGLVENRPYFAVTDIGIQDDRYTFTHELSHTFGCSHDNSFCTGLADDGTSLGGTICSSTGMMNSGERKPIYSGEKYILASGKEASMWGNSIDNCAHCMRSIWNSVANIQAEKISPGCLQNTDCGTGHICTDNSCVASCQGNNANCNDNNPCTVDTCNANNLCDYTAVAGCCQVDSDCGNTDVCQANPKQCDQSTNTCLSLSQVTCAPPEVCNSALGQCECDPSAQFGCCKGGLDNECPDYDNDACNGVYSCDTNTLFCVQDAPPVTCSNSPHATCNPTDGSCACNAAPSASNNFCCDSDQECSAIVNLCNQDGSNSPPGVGPTCNGMSCSAQLEDCSAIQHSTCEPSLGCCMPDKKVCVPDANNAQGNCCPGNECKLAGGGNHKCTKI